MFYKCLLIAFLIAAFSCKDDVAVVSTPDTEIRVTFSAVIVTDLQASVAWYNSVFGMSVKDLITDSAGEIALLTSSNLEVELLQLHTAINRSTTLDGQPEGTQIQGLYKIGFLVDDMDSWLTHLNNLGIATPEVNANPLTSKRYILISDPDGNLIHFFEK